MTKIAVFGMGYVGCVTAACLSRNGFHVTGVDIDAEKVDTINAGRSPVQEPDLDDLVRSQVSKGQLTATTNLVEAVRESNLAMIAVGTPSAPDGSVESRAVERVVASIADVLAQTSESFTLVIRSTLLPGVLEARLTPILQEAIGADLGSRVHLCNNPEFLRETTAIRDFDNPPFIIIGAESAEAADLVMSIYGDMECERVVTDSRTSAMVKYTCNAFHALKVGFANEIGSLAKSMGADGQEVMRIACLDKQLNISSAYLRPGFAFGGSCLPKDVRAMVRFAQREAIPANILSAILPSNEAQINNALALIRDHGCKKIGLVGLSFKAGTDDLRESPQVILAETLLGRGFDLRIYDPGVRVAGLVGSNLHYVDTHLPHLAGLLMDDATELFDHSELLILATGIADGLDWQLRFTGEVVDLRRDLNVQRSAITVNPSFVDDDQD